MCWKESEQCSPTDSQYGRCRWTWKQKRSQPRKGYSKVMVDRCRCYGVSCILFKLNHAKNEEGTKVFPQRNDVKVKTEAAGLIFSSGVLQGAVSESTFNITGRRQLRGFEGAKRASQDRSWAGDGFETSFNSVSLHKSHHFFVFFSPPLFSV